MRSVRAKRAEWFPRAAFKTAASPVGERESHTSARVTLLDILREWNVRPIWRDTANNPDTILAMIEELSGYLRRRTLTGREESFAVNSDPDRWVVVSREGEKSQMFLHWAFEGGYIWDPTMVSVSNKRIIRPKEDDWYATAMRCVENLLLTFCMHQPSEAARAQAQQRQRDREVTAAQDSPYQQLGTHSWMAM
jgi:hypothetical protein